MLAEKSVSIHRYGQSRADFAFLEGFQVGWHARGKLFDRFLHCPKGFPACRFHAFPAQRTLALPARIFPGGQNSLARWPHLRATPALASRAAPKPKPLATRVVEGPEDLDDAIGILAQDRCGDSPQKRPVR